MLAIFDCSPAEQKPERIRWRQCLDQPADWYSSEEAIRIGDNLLLFEYPSGGWPKNIDMAQELSELRKEQILHEWKNDSSTIDNAATYTQLRYLAKIYTSTKLDRFRASFLKGFDYLITAQYSNGGWPQFYPLRRGYYSHITFNDNAMTGVLNLFRDVVRGQAEFHFVDLQRRERANAAIEKGIACILNCQIVVHGELTAWCAQHDELTFQPAEARSYELVSESGAESVGVLEFLIGIDYPSPKLIRSIQSAVAWFNQVKIKNIRVDNVDDAHEPRGKNKIVVSDSFAPPMWARFYEIGTNKPIFCSRDGIMHDSLSQITYERRNHYVWLGYWPDHLLNEEYPKWAKKNKVRNVLQ
jgi:PelA/Pel-15E family pectate lyase